MIDCALNSVLTAAKH